jgi:hypothetical protein
MIGRSRAGEHKSNGKCLASLALLISSLLVAVAFTTLNAEVASAQFGGAVPPPVGDGPTPEPVNPGDTTGPSAVPTGAADPTPGTNNATAPGRDRTVIRLYDNGATGRGRRMVQTLRPDTLSAEAQSRIGGILGVNMNSGEQSIDVTVSKRPNCSNTRCPSCLSSNYTSRWTQHDHWRRPCRWLSQTRQRQPLSLRWSTADSSYFLSLPRHSRRSGLNSFHGDCRLLSGDG